MTCYQVTGRTSGSLTYFETPEPLDKGGVVKNRVHASMCNEREEMKVLNFFFSSWLQFCVIHSKDHSVISFHHNSSSHMIHQTLKLISSISQQKNQLQLHLK